MHEHGGSDELRLASGARGSVISALRGQIEAGDLRPGDALPSERMLAISLGVSRDTIRAALVELTKLGWIETGRGSRRRVSSDRRDGMSALSNCIAILSAEDSQIFDADKPWVEDRYVMALAAAALEQQGYHVVNVSMTALRQNRSDRARLGDMRAFVVAANMVDHPAVAQLVANMDRIGSPVILYGRSAGHDHRPSVSSDHHVGAKSLAAWLHQHGRRRIACAWMRTMDRAWMTDRYAGYLAAMRDVGLEPLPLIDIPRIADGDGGQDTFDRQARTAAGYLAEHMRAGAGIDAIMALNDPQAICLAAACRKLGFEPNVDVWLAGYDNSWRYAKEWAFERAGAMVTVDKGNAAMARSLAELTLAMIAGSASAESGHVRCVPTVVTIDAQVVSVRPPHSPVDIPAHVLQTGD